MYCPTGDEESLRNLVTMAVATSALPMVAFLYSLLVWVTYFFYVEIGWTNAQYLKAMFLRFTVLVSSWAAVVGAMSLCGTCGETTISDDSRSRGCLIGTIVLLAVVYAGISAKLILSTRKKEVVGVDAVPFYGSQSLQGKFMIVTGANNGIGFETTRQLAAQGATIAMLCRNPKRANKAIDDIITIQEDLHAKDPSKAGGIISRDQLLFVPLDLTDFDSIRQAAKAVGQLLKERSQTTQHPSFVDALIFNAGLMMGIQSTTKNGLETMMQANHLGHFLLMKLMLDEGMLRTKGDGTSVSKEPSRVCILTSSTYLFAASASGFDFSDPYCSNGQRKYTLFGQYSMTKLANLLISKELAKRCNTGGASETETALAVFAIHPGIVRTNVTSNMNWYYRWPNKIFAWIIAALQKTPAEGAYSTVYTAAAPLAEIPFWKKGSYIINCREQTANDYVEGPSGSLDATRLWEWSEEQLSEGAKDDDEKKEQ